MTDDKPLIQEAPQELLALAVAVRPDWNPEETWNALLAARTAGWAWTRTVHETVRLMLVPDGEPSGLRHAARAPLARSEPGKLAPDLRARALAACESATAAHRRKDRDEAAGPAWSPLGGHSLDDRAAS